jgi:hypothetical protein
MAWYDNVGGKSAVREYRSRREFESEAAAAAAVGWRVVTVTESQQRAGCLRGCMLGLMALVWKPKNKLIVSYAHD